MDQIEPKEDKKYIKTISEAFSLQPTHYTVGGQLRVGTVGTTLSTQKLVEPLAKIVEEYKDEFGQPAYLVLRGYLEDGRKVFEVPSRGWNITYEYRM